MAHLKFISAKGQEREVEAKVGASVMQTAKENGVEGIVGRCGGSLACSTCHVFVEDQSAFAPISEYEDEMLDGTFVERTSQSRLSCQLDVSEACEGLEIRTPAEQG